MAAEAFMWDGNQYKKVKAEDPNLSPEAEYFCSGICDNKKTCMCPVSLIEPGDEGWFVRHFRRTQKAVKHGKGCTHADDSLFRYVDHLDHSGKDMTDEDILKIGLKAKSTQPRPKGHVPDKGYAYIETSEERDSDDNRQAVQRQRQPRSIYQLYLVLSDPETKEYGGRKKAERIVNNETVFFHRKNPMDGVMLVVAEKRFEVPENVSEKACIVFQDTHFVPKQSWNRLTFVVEFDSNDLYCKIRDVSQIQKGNFKQKFLVLGNWTYDAVTCAYYTTLMSSGHFKILKADQDVEA